MNKILSRKKKGKKNGVFLIIFFLIFSIIQVSAQGDRETNQLLIQADATQGLKEMPMPPVGPLGESYIRFDDGTTGNSIGLTSGGTFEAAIRITPEEFEPYYNWWIIGVIFYHAEAGTHSGKLKVYEMGSASQPGDVLSQEPYTVTGEGWKRIIFSQPVLIGPSADKWVSVQITHIADEFPIGTDSGPAVPTKGDWIYAGGWDELRNFNFDYNWNVVAIVYTYDASYDVDAGGPYTGVIGEEPVQFNGTATGGIWPYYWNWDFGDGSTSELEDPVHSYARPGNYNVTLEGFDSDLSGDIDTTTVTVTVAPRFEVTPLSGGIGINTVIKNNGSGNATNLQWTIKVTGGFLGLINKTFTKTIPTLAVGKETKVRTGMFFGFGSIYITFSATCDQNRSAHQIADGKIVLFWVNIG